MLIISSISNRKIHIYIISNAPILSSGNDIDLQRFSFESKFNQFRCFFFLFFLILIYLDTIRKELEPLKTKVEHLHKSHSKRYNQLKTVENK